MSVLDGSLARFGMAFAGGAAVRDLAPSPAPTYFLPID
jgi:hypothetical protein